MEEHTVNLGLSYCRSSSTGGHAAGCQRSRGTSLEQLLADAGGYCGFCWTKGHSAGDFAAGMELQVEQAAAKRTQRRRQGETPGREKSGTSFPEQHQQYQTWGWSTFHLLEQLSVLNLTQGAGTEPLLVLHSPQAAQQGWHGLPLLCPSIGAAGELLWPEMGFGH